MTGPRILFWDIENTPILLTAWSLYDERNSHHNIIEDWKLISAAWKWEDSDVEAIAWKATTDRKKSPFLGKDDSNIIRKLHSILSQADILVAHNGDAFDWKKFQTRSLQLGLSPIAPKLMIDTLKVAKKEFKVTSNRLDYLGKFLGVGKKVETPSGLHMSVMKNEPNALKTMVQYNKGDVLLLEAVYKKLKPYIRNHPNYNLFVNDKRPLCPRCGSAKIKRDGQRYTRNGARQLFRCLGCHSQMTGKLLKAVKIASS